MFLQEILDADHLLTANFPLIFATTVQRSKAHSVPTEIRTLGLLTAVFYHLQDVTNLNVRVPIRRNRPLIYTTHTHTHTRAHTHDIVS